jgi:hypothetical protein
MDIELKEQLLDLVVNSETAAESNLVLISPTNILEISIKETPHSATNTEAIITLNTGYKHTFQYNRENIKAVIDAVLGDETITIFENSTETDVISFLNSKGLAVTTDDLDVQIIAGRSVSIQTTSESIRYKGKALYELNYEDGTAPAAIKNLTYRVGARTLHVDVENAKGAEVLIETSTGETATVTTDTGSLRHTFAEALSKNDLITVSVAESTGSLTVPEFDSYGVYITDVKVNLKTKNISGKASGVGAVQIVHALIPSDVNATTFGANGFFTYQIPQNITGFKAGDVIAIKAATKVFEYVVKAEDLDTTTPPQTEFIDSITYNATTREVSVAVRGITSVNITYPGIGAEDVAVVAGVAKGTSPRPISNGAVIVVTGGTQTLTKQVVTPVTVSNLVVDLIALKLTASTQGTSTVIITGPSEIDEVAAVLADGSVDWTIPSGDYIVGDVFRITTSADNTKFVEHTLVAEDLPPEPAEPFVTNIIVDPETGTITGKIKDGLGYVEMYLAGLNGTGVAYPTYGTDGNFTVTGDFNIKPGDKIRFVNEASEDFEYEFNNGTIYAEITNIVPATKTITLTVHSPMGATFSFEHGVDDLIEQVTAGAGTVTVDVNYRDEDKGNAVYFYGPSFRISTNIAP